jgi:hypothetical protein
MEIDWQHAVYTRKNARELFTFSHIGSTKIKKSFPTSLSILQRSKGLHQSNLRAFQRATVLILVTGKWAIHISLDNFDLSKLPSRYTLGKFDMEYNNELSHGYHALKYHCTIASYTQGIHHTWSLDTVAPILCDCVILPKILEEGRLKCIMSSFGRATRKSLRDSLLLAGNQSVKEGDWHNF